MLLLALCSSPAPTVVPKFQACCEWGVGRWLLQHFAGLGRDYLPQIEAKIAANSCFLFF